MKEQFSRLSLIIGEENLDVIKTKKIIVFGVGGVGGHVVDALARSGVEDITIVDNDVVNMSNINRQLIASISTLGEKKVDVMEKHLLDINPDIKVTKLDCFYLPNEVDIDFTKYDYVIDAIDTVAAKIDIIEKCHKLNVPIISALGCGNKLDPSLLELTDISKTSYDPLAKVLRKELRDRGINHLKVVYSKEQRELANKGKTPGSSAFVPSSAGLLIASAVIRDIIDKK